MAQLLVILEFQKVPFIQVPNGHLEVLTRAGERNYILTTSKYATLGLDLYLLNSTEEKKGELRGLKLTYIGDGNNMAHSLLYGCARMGMTVAIGHPRGYAPDADVVTRAREIASESGGGVLITEDPKEAASQADVMYTDVWVSMGQEEETKKRRQHFDGFIIDNQLMGLARPNAIFMHCLPAHRGEEVGAEVIDGPQSVVFDQAENRLHAQKAIMIKLMGRRH